VTSIVIPDDWGDAFFVWSAEFVVVNVAGTGEMFFGVRIGGAGQPLGLTRYNLLFTTPGSRTMVYGLGTGIIRPGSVVELFGRMLTADSVDLVAGGFSLEVM
jgi:hypothetical protein